MDSIAKKLHISTPEGWANITKDTLYKYGGSTLLLRYGSLSRLFNTIYPELRNHPALRRTNILWYL